MYISHELKFILECNYIINFYFHFTLTVGENIQIIQYNNMFGIVILMPEIYILINKN